MENENDFYTEAFSRNIGIITQKQQDKLKSSTVAIGGLGGGGGIHAYTFARLGVGNFHIADIDVFNVINVNRQIGATVENMGMRKTEGIKKMILSINPTANVTVFDEGVQEHNVDDFLKGVDIVVDGIDFFNIETRRMIFRKAREKGIYAITAGPIGYGSAVLVFSPKGITFDNYMDFKDGQTKNEKYLRFGLGITPTLLQTKYFDPDAVNWKEEKAPSLVIGTLLAANLIATEACKILFGQLERVHVAPSSLHFDPYLGKLKKAWFPFGNKNPIQRIKRIVITFVLRSKGKI